MCPQSLTTHRIHRCVSRSYDFSVLLVILAARSSLSQACAYMRTFFLLIVVSSRFFFAKCAHHMWTQLLIRRRVRSTSMNSVQSRVQITEYSIRYEHLSSIEVAFVVCQIDEAMRTHPQILLLRKLEQRVTNDNDIDCANIALICWLMV